MAAQNEIEAVATIAQPVAIELIGRGMDRKGASVMAAMFTVFMRKNEAATVGLAKEIGPEAATDAAMVAFEKFARKHFQNDTESVSPGI